MKSNIKKRILRYMYFNGEREVTSEELREKLPFTMPQILYALHELNRKGMIKRKKDEKIFHTLRKKGFPFNRYILNPEMIRKSIGWFKKEVLEKKYKGEDT